MAVDRRTRSVTTAGRYAGAEAVCRRGIPRIEGNVDTPVRVLADRIVPRSLMADRAGIPVVLSVFRVAAGSAGVVRHVPVAASAVQVVAPPLGHCIARGSARASCALDIAVAVDVRAVSIRGTRREVTGGAVRLASVGPDARSRIGRAEGPGYTSVHVRIV